MITNMMTEITLTVWQLLFLLLLSVWLGMAIAGFNSAMRSARDLKRRLEQIGVGSSHSDTSFKFCPTCDHPYEPDLTGSCRTCGSDLTDYE